jgi:transcriptional regulator with XRE-family HTH domain
VESSRSIVLTEQAISRAFARWNIALAAGRRLRWPREQAGLSRYELAEFAGMSARTLARVEAGERVLTGHERAAVARGIGVSIGFLAVDSSGSGSNGSGRRVA